MTLAIQRVRATCVALFQVSTRQYGRPISLRTPPQSVRPNSNATHKLSLKHSWAPVCSSGIQPRFESMLLLCHPACPFRAALFGAFPLIEPQLHVTSTATSRALLSSRVRYSWLTDLRLCDWGMIRFLKKIKSVTAIEAPVRKKAKSFQSFVQ